MKKRYALVGTGGRGVYMYAKPIVEKYGAQAELVAMCDVNRKRLELANSIIKRNRKRTKYSKHASLLEKSSSNSNRFCENAGSVLAFDIY